MYLYVFECYCVWIMYVMDAMAGTSGRVVVKAVVNVIYEGMRVYICVCVWDGCNVRRMHTHTLQPCRCQSIKLYTNV